MDNGQLTETDIVTNGVRLHVIQAGPQEGPLVILLHGFPEFWFSWHQQIAPLAAAGYRVWVPDQRGYGLSEKPAGIKAYRIDQLAADVVGLIDAAGERQAIVVGHDWGAAVAWHTALKYPERVARLAILNVPHPVVMVQNLRSNPRQLLKSWYIFFFQLPWLPETLIALGNWRAGVASLQGSSRSGTFNDKDIELYRNAWSQPHAMTSMINWYRAMIKHPPKINGPQITVPTQIIWGMRDRFLSADMARQSLAFCRDGRLAFIETATHWVQHEEPKRVNAILLSFMNEATTQPKV